MAAERAKGVTVVVGVGEGLGAALARRFATGYRVALVARSADVIEKVAGEIRAGGGVAVPIQSDGTATCRAEFPGRGPSSSCRRHDPVFFPERRFARTR